MEAVKPQERASTIGLTHLTFDVMFSPAQLMAGYLMAAGNFLALYAVAAAVSALAGLVFYWFFRGAEVGRVPRAAQAD